MGKEYFHSQSSSSKIAMAALTCAHTIMGEQYRQEPQLTSPLQTFYVVVVLSSSSSESEVQHKSGKLTKSSRARVAPRRPGNREQSSDMFLSSAISTS
mmetsp:Transcript_34402/g.107873  ORF Transcript_34402/g.107873 Transcript_34402/m.107873 type:complete len:98 (-) Transcript_34402:2500-2793(-)